MTATLNPSRPATAGRRLFDPDTLTELPAPATAYLRHAIAPGSPLPVGVRMSIHGQLKVGTWLPFSAVQTIDPEWGFRWTATVAGGLLSSIDRLDDGQAATRLGIAGLVPLVHARGPQTARSALGRFLTEQAAWLPWTLLPEYGTHWHVDDEGGTVAAIPFDGGYGRVTLGIGPDGRLLDVRTLRWGRSAGRYGWIPFGMVATAESTVGDFTIATGGRIGWWYGTPRWHVGERLRFTIDRYDTY